MGTGTYVRIMRDGKPETLEFTELTDAELDVFANEHKGDGWRWAIFLAKWIRDNCESP